MKKAQKKGKTSLMKFKKKLKISVHTYRSYFTFIEFFLIQSFDIIEIYEIENVFIISFLIDQKEKITVYRKTVKNSASI